MFKIEVAGETHIPLIADIANKTWWTTYSGILSPKQIHYMLKVIYDHEVLRSEIVRAEQTYLVLHDADAYRGFASFAVRPDDIRVGKIHKLYVLPEDQKKGFGQALIEDVKRRLSEKGMEAIDLNVNRFNSARYFYERMGFRVVREEDIPIGPYWMNDYVMRLELKTT